MTAPPNVLLLTVDSLRADHLGCYGYQQPTSPRLDAVAAEGVLCERLFCTSIPTHPSYTTLYTGQHALTHGIVSLNGTATLDPDTPVLAELFARAGYTTCALDNLWHAHKWFGRGYEYYIDPSVHHIFPFIVSCEELNARAIPWLRAHSAEPFFLFMHYWDTHYPYVPPDRYRHLFYQGRNPVDPANHSLDGAWHHPAGLIARETWLRTTQGVVTDADYVTALYDQELRYVDDGVAALLGALEELGLAENTVVFILADHGESIAEHGVFFEHYGLYNCTLRVPLLARWPGRLPAGARLAQLLHSTDVAPTVLDAAGLPVPTTMEGRSFWPLLTAETTMGGHDRVISLECSYQAKWSLCNDRYKLILAREPDFMGNPPRELYDLVADPDERHNIAAREPRVVAALEQELEEWITARLRALGRADDPLRGGISLRHELEPV